MTTTARAHTVRILDRLKRQYRERVLLPRSDGRHVYPCEEVRTGRCVCGHQDGYRLGLNQLHRLYRHILAEGYGL